MWCWLYVVFFLRRRRPPRSTRTDTLFPYTTLFRSVSSDASRRSRWPTDLNLGPPAPLRRPLLDLHPAPDQDGHRMAPHPGVNTASTRRRSEEHTSELQSLMRISYAVFCLKTKTTDNSHHMKRRPTNCQPITGP